MATSGSPFRKSRSIGRENWAPRGTAASIRVADTIADSQFKDRQITRTLIEREAYERDRYRSHSPIMRDQAARSAAVLESIRLQQVDARYGVPTRIPPPLLRPPQEITVVKTFTHHQDAFLSDLQNEVNELRMQQKDYHALNEQFRYLQDQYNAMQGDRQHFENDCLAKIAEDRKQADALIAEVDGLRLENTAVEKEQIDILDQIVVCEKDVQAANNELVDLRHQVSSVDMLNLNVRKEVDHCEVMICDQKEVNHANYGELCRLKDASYELDRQIAALVKNINAMRAELQNHEQRLISMEEMLANTEGRLQDTLVRIADAHAHITDLKHTLNKMDSELGYFESLNEQHKGAQGQLFKANEHEYVVGKDGSLRCQELQIALSKVEQDEKSLLFELDRLKQQSDQMLHDQGDLRGEIDALNKHMANLNNVNYGLQKELTDFVETDEAVKRNLDRKHMLAARVDDVIHRSQMEVASRERAFSRGLPGQVITETVEVGPAGRRMAKSASHYSPLRPEPVRRTAWAGPEPPMVTRQTVANTRNGSAGPRDPAYFGSRASYDAAMTRPTFQERLNK